MGIDPLNVAMPCASSYGDLVVGLINVFSPASFVGQMGSPADMVAQGLMNGLMREAGTPPPGMPTVRINGRPVGTTAEWITALPASPIPAVARMWIGSGIARIGGQAMTLQWGMAHATPMSVMANMGGTQSIVRLDPKALSQPSQGLGAMLGADPSMLADLRGSIPSRTAESFGAEGSPLAQILEGCSPGRYQDLELGSNEVLVGDPVNVVTGAVITQTVDYEQVAPPLRLRRRYDSRRSGRRSSLGWGWTHDLEQSIVIEPRRVVLRDGDGREKEFSTRNCKEMLCRPGDVLTDATGGYTLRCVDRLQWELADGTSVRHFAEVPGEGAAEREQGTARLTRVAHRDAPLVELEYASGRLVEVHVGGTRVLRFEYGASGLLRRFFATAGGGEVLQAEFEHSGEGDLLTAKDAHGHARHYEYVDHLLVRETNRDGGSFHYGYDGAGPRARCVRTWGDGGYLGRTLEHDPGAGMTTVHDSQGQPTVYHYDAAGCVTSIDGPRGRRRLQYDERLRLVQIKWGDGTREIAKYDSKGNLVERVERGGARWTMQYGPDGRMVAGTDPQGGRWSYAHDERGRLRRVEDPSGHATRFDFDERGGLCRVTDPTGHQQFMRLDEHGRITEMPRPGEGGRVGYTYDERGLVQAARDSEDRRTQWSYDVHGRLTRRDGTKTRTAWERSPEGHILAEQHGQRLVRVRRDGFGLVRGIDLPERAVSYVLDTEGRLMKASDSSEVLLSLERSEQGLVEAFEAPTLGRVELERAPLSTTVTGIVQPQGLVRLEQDEAGRITRLTQPDGSTWDYTYRPDGLLMKASNDRVTCSWTRLPRGAITEHRFGDVEIGDLYPDHLGRRAGLRLGKDLRVSYLRSASGAVDDVAIVAGSEVEAGTKVRERTSTPIAPTQAAPEAATPAAVSAVDPLWRPISPEGASAMVWDEDHCVVLDGQTRIHHPEDGTLLFVVRSQGQVDAVAQGDSHRPVAAEPAALDRMHDAAFPPLACQQEAAEDALPTPHQLLRQLLGYRVWNPRPRPLPGQAPWNPDDWQSQVESAEPDDGRLDPETVLGAMGAPHPRPALAI